MTHTAEPRRAPVFLHAAGAVSLLAWVWLALLSGRGMHGLLGWMLGVQALAWAALLAVFLRRPDAPLRVVWLWAVLFRVAGFFATPVLEDDWFRFLWDGRVFALTGNPYATAPAASFGDATLPEPFQRILDRVNYPDVPTIYGPVCQYAFAACYAVAPGRLWPWKLLLFAADCCTIAALQRLARDGKPALFFAWCPLVIFETACNAHPESLAVALLVAAIAISGPRKTVALTATLCALAVGAKIFALLPAPLILRRLPRRAWIVFAAILTLLYAPFWLQGSTADLAGLRAMAGEWEFNSSLFALAQLAIPPPAARMLCATIFAAVWLCVAWRQGPARDPVRALLQRSALLFAAFLLLSPTVNPWYLLWLLPSVALSPSRAGVVALAAVSLSYVTGLNLGHAHLRNFEHPAWLRPLEYGAIALAAIWDWARARASARVPTAG